MRRLWLWAAPVVLLPVLAAERWELQYFYDKDDSTLVLTDLQFPSPTRGVACGTILQDRRRKPVLAHTSDGGRRWDLLPIKEAALSLFFLDERTGWMVGEKGGLFATADGGRSWTSAKPAGVRAGPQPIRVFFLDASRGWLLCSRKQVYETRDGGRSWQLLAASREPGPDLPEARTLYTQAAFFRQTGLLTGWSRLLDRRSRLPAWMEPDMAALGAGPTTTLALHSFDQGRSWKSQLLPDFGEIARLRVSSAGAAVMLLRRPDSVSRPSELVVLDLATLRARSIYADKNRWLADVAFAGAFPVSGRVFAAALDQEGRLPTPTLPAKLRVLTSPDLTKWTEMEVDYRAEARHATLAAPDAAHAWIATDTGMILRWVPE